MPEKRPVYRYLIALSALLLIVAVAYVARQWNSPRPAAAPTSTNTGHPDTHTTGAISPSAGTKIIPGCKIQDITLNSPGAGAIFGDPDTLEAVDGVLTTTLRVEYGNNAIGECPVHLRSYNGKLVGPTLRVRPGDTLRITLENHLPQDEPNMHHVINTIGALNHTNLHTHGLHVSPAGNSDNVLLDIAPGETFEYEIKIPKDHVPGTFWYHAHLHGSTATQLASGMEGALIIMGDRVPGTVDSLPSIKTAVEKIFVFQQLIYDERGQLEPDAGGGAPPSSFPTYVTPTPPSSFPNSLSFFGPCNWEPMKREHLINGQLFPLLKMISGEVQRWRFIDAGIRESIGVELRGPYQGSGIPTIDDVLKLPNVKLNEIAVDGIALRQVDKWDQVELEPGYRSDVMVQVTQAGKYFLVDTSVPQTTVTLDPNNPNDPGAYVTNKDSSFSLTCPPSVSGTPLLEKPNFLASIVVSDPKTSKEKQLSTMSLPTTEELHALPVPEQLNPIVAITTDKTVTTPANQAFYVALEPIDAFQKVDFTVAVHPVVFATAPAANPTSTPMSPPVAFMAADHPFDLQNPRRLTLGNTDMWVLNTQQDSLYYGHPFHIHVNPFQTARLGPDRQTYELVWRDTIFVPQGIPIYIFTRYQDYIGAYVYHCHILDHEDQGMMELVEIVNP